jgi:hypothetical protein
MTKTAPKSILEDWGECSQKPVKVYIKFHPCDDARKPNLMQSPICGWEVHKQREQMRGDVEMWKSGDPGEIPDND